MSEDVEIGERCRGEGKRIETWSAIPLKLIYRPEGRLQACLLLLSGLRKEE